MISHQDGRRFDTNDIKYINNAALSKKRSSAARTSTHYFLCQFLGSEQYSQHIVKSEERRPIHIPAFLIETGKR